MDIVYAAEAVTAREVEEAMEEPPTNAAVRAILRSLVEKGQLRHEQDGRRYVYRPTLPRREARRSALEHVLDTFFGGSLEGAMATLLEMRSSELTDEDHDRLRRLIDQAREEGR
jgi:predicted transcriptional regulator